MRASNASFGSLEDAMASDDISEVDLQAYVDGELDVKRAVQVEDFLARHPDEAVRVMADLRTRSALRLLAGSGLPISAPIRRTALRLRRGFRKRGIIRAMSASTIAAALLALLLPTGGLPLLGGHGSAAAAPAYVDDALMSHRTTLLRAAMASQPETTHFDPADLMRATRIRVPRLPEGWRIHDVQLFPSDEGPALQLSVRTREGQLYSIFAVRASTSAPKQPSAVRRGGESIAFWRQGDLSYALTGAVTPEELGRVADDLEDNAFS
jgi:anti-sigma factor RsiW